MTLLFNRGSYPHLHCEFDPIDGRYIACHDNGSHNYFETIVFDTDTWEEYSLDCDYCTSPPDHIGAFPLSDGKWWHLVKECGSWGRSMGEMVVLESRKPPSRPSIMIEHPTYAWCSEENLAGHYTYTVNNQVVDVYLNKDGTFVILNSSDLSGTGSWRVDYDNNIVLEYRDWLLKKSVTPGWFVYSYELGSTICGGEGKPDIWCMHNEAQ